MELRKFVALLITAAFTLGALTACTGTFTQRERDRSDRVAVQEQNMPALLLMVPNDSPASDHNLLEIIDSLNSLNPSVDISVTLSPNYEADLTEALLSKHPPDVFLVTGSLLPELADRGVVAPISTDLIEHGQLLQAAAQSIELQGEPYCFPHSIHTLALIYNVDLFEEFGAQLPSPDWDWDDLAATASLLTDTDQGTVGIVLEPSPLSWIPFYIQAGGELHIDDEGDIRFSAGAGELAADYVAGLFADGAATTPGLLEAAWSGDAFTGGSVGMTIAGDWILPTLEAAPPPFAYATSELPSGSGLPANVGFSNCLAVHANSLNADLALQLADQLTEPEVLARWTGGEGETLSVYIEQDVISDQGRTHLDPFLRALRYATPWRLGSIAEQYANRFEEGLTLVSNEEMQAEEFWPYLLRSGFPATSP